MSTQKRKSNNNYSGKNRDIIGIVYVIISSFFLICLVTPLLSDIGTFVKNLTTGLLGFMSYPITLCTLFYGIMLLMNKKAVLSRKQIAFVVLMSVCAVLILQTALDSDVMKGSLGEYISGIFSLTSIGLSVGGVIFGFVSYAVKAVLSFVGAYILYSLLFVLFAGLLILSTRAQKNLKKTTGRPQNQNLPFEKGKSAAQPVRDLFDTTLFVGTIERNSKVNSYSGEFSTMNSPFNDTMHRYGEVKNSETQYVSQNQTAFLNAEEEQRQQALDKLFGSHDAIRKSYDELIKSNMNIREHMSGRSNYLIEDDQVIKPIPHVSSPKIDNDATHKQIFPDVPVPPEKDVSNQYVFGPILNGEEVSRTINDDTDTPVNYESKDETSELPPIITGNSIRKSSNSEPQVSKPEEKPVELPPIVNGDLFAKKEEAKSETATVEEAYYIEPQNDESENVEELIKSEEEQIAEQEYEQPQQAEDDIYSSFAAANEEAYEQEVNRAPIIAGSDNTFIQEDFSDKEDSYLELDIDENNFEQGFEEGYSFEDSSNEDLSIEQEEEEFSIKQEENNSTENISYNDYIEENQSFPEAKIPDSLKFIDEEIDMSETREEVLNDNTGYYVSEGFDKNVGEISLKLNDTKMGMKKGGISNQINMDDYDVVVPEAAKPKKKKKHLRYNPPPVDMLINNSTPYGEGEDCEEKANVLEESLRDLKIGAKVINITKGPAVTRYELEMPLGQSVNKITSRGDDIAYALAAPGKIRIEAPIRGKRAVGVEVPNEKIAVVSLREIIDSKEFSESKSALTLALGKGITGNIMTCNLEKMPHLLIAGTTGSGKSACLNSIIISIIYKASPDDVRLILVDPKQVEFVLYRDMPHLLMKNIIKDSVQACNAFKWAREEMDRRYAVFAQYAVRNISDYNECAAVKSGMEQKMPRIVIVVDELAELMLAKNSKELEQNIMSLAQKARAAGVHLILATQRPSVDVITGTIKANFPSRIAFAVKSIPDSRTILDQIGAESLLGRGDMLYAPIDSNDPIRVQGAFVTTEEVESIINFVRENNEVDYDEAAESIIMKKPEEEVALSADDDKGGEAAEDPLMKDVLRRVIESKAASASQIQRRFSVGYNRASRILDQMEEKGYVGPMDGSKPREVYITREKFKEIYGEDA